MERLTERNPAWIDDELYISACEPDDETIDAIYRRLKMYEDAEEHKKEIEEYENTHPIDELSSDDEECLEAMSKQELIELVQSLRSELADAQETIEYLNDTIDDNSDVPERFTIGNFTRLSLIITVDDAYLWDTR